MAELSPAAQAVMAAATRNTHLQTDPVYRECIAAALRAAANIFRKAYEAEEYVDSPDDWLDDIAAELESKHG